MYISPNSTIKLLANCPLNNTYEHTIYFTNTTNQQKFFNSLVIRTFNQQTYTRHTNNQIKLAVRADTILNANYMMFQNTYFGSKWFYAFVNSVEYVSNDVSLITYEIDVMQTYFFQYTLKQCYVEREHTSSDTIGSNTQPEPVDTGEYYRHVNYNYVNCNPTNALVTVTKYRPKSDDDTGEPAEGQYINGVYSGLGHYYIESINTTNGENAINTLLFMYTKFGQEQNVISITQIPSQIKPNKSASVERFNTNISYGSFDGYTPKNRKLYTYPYQFLSVSNQMGMTGEFPFENFAYPTAITFNIYGTMLPTAEICAVPQNYLGLAQDFSSAINITDFPMCSWAGDSYKQYIALNKNSMLYNNISNAVSGIAGTATNALAGNYGGAASSVFGMINSVAGMTAQRNDAKNLPNHAHGQNSGNGILSGTSQFKIVFYRSHIKSEYARRIDDFFSRYGYATNQLKIPNRNVRPHWTYTKTKNCCITGSVPNDSAKQICNIYNNGITFWNNGNNVGNFSLDNSI